MAKSKHYRHKNGAMYLMLAPYLLLLFFFGILPAIMGVLEVPKPSMANADGGWDAFSIVVQDFRFAPAFRHVMGFMAMFVPLMIIFVIGMALMLDIKPSPWKKWLRMAYIVPASISGAVAVLVWYVILQPTLSPIKGVLKWFNITESSQIWQQKNLVYILVVMAFFAAAGNWILIQYGSLQSISTEILEAARVDGCSVFQMALRIKLPLISKYIIYMSVLVFAGGLQIFVEPQLLNGGIYAGIADSWSFDQLSYNLAFMQGDFGGASALSILLLIPSLLGALLVIFKTDMFEGATGHAKKKEVEIQGH
ncbi:MAG: sugar ABC transporter permease [Actinobacteria bacterium]|nr:sugar ABC transporter permease [Actinomycetota bacterium]